MNYLIITDQKNQFSNTTSLSNAHCRIPKSNELEPTIRLSIDKYGDSEDVVRFVYSRAENVLELFNELSLDYANRAFGVIPVYNVKGGYVLLKKLHEGIHSILTNASFINFQRSGREINSIVKRGEEFIDVSSNNLVFASGGFGGKFKHTDCFRYNDYSLFNSISSQGLKTKNLECLFVHPFGYKSGKLILTGIESSRGEFVNSNGNYAFDENIRKMIKGNDYHEIFDEVLGKIEAIKESGSKIYFKDKNRRVEISPTVHYTAGGIETDIFGGVMGNEGIYAIGECRADGSKNGGRLPGYAFTSSIVHAKNLADILAR